MGTGTCNLGGSFNNSIYLGNYIKPFSETVNNEIVIGFGTKVNDVITLLMGKGPNTCLIQGDLYTTKSNLSI